MEEKTIEKVNEKIKEIVDDEITPNNLDYLYKLSKIKHLTKEDKNMNYNGYNNYGEYGRDSYGRERYGNYNNYGEYGRGSYNARGRDMKYRGDDSLDRMANEYGRYMENRERYGAGKETEESYRYMTEALKDFTKYLFEIAETPQQKQMLMDALQNSMR